MNPLRHVRKRKDFAGQWGCRIVISRCGSDGERSTWNCECAVCGRVHVATSKQLVRRESMCSRNDCNPGGQRKTFTGQWGCRVVIGPVGSDGDRSLWDCRCVVCGREHVATSQQLVEQYAYCSRNECKRRSTAARAAE
jgi:hypothetical protein